MTRITVGSVDFSGGIDSGRVPIAASEHNPNGLKSNQNAWLANASVRGGGIYPRPGQKKLAAFDTELGLFQDAAVYQPDNADPYLLAQIAGRTFIVRTDLNNEIEEVTILGDQNPFDLPQSWTCQAEQFLVIQDGQSIPLAWDGNMLFRLNSGYKPHIPPGQAMSYYMGRLWISSGREVVGSDIVGSPATPTSGTAFYDYRDSVLYMTENEFETEGGTFRMPTNSGNIRGMDWAANLDTILGEGQLFIFSREAVYSLSITPDRSTWQTQEEPPIRVAQINFGAVSDRSIVRINGDLFYQSMDGVRSLTLAIRNFGQWGNVPISKEENRLIQFNDRSLSRYSFGFEFNNRVFQSVLPFQTDVGVAFRALMPLDFDVLGSLTDRLPPCWEGAWEGLDFLKVVSADYGGLQRAFAFVRSQLTGGIEVWELTSGELRDNGDNRIEWMIETPSHTWGMENKLKELDTLELWIDRLYGTVNFAVDYREDQNPCWKFWHQFELCAARDACEVPDILTNCDYPVQDYREQNRTTVVLPKAKPYNNALSKRPSNMAYSFQFRIRIRGNCRIRGYWAHAFLRDKSPYEGQTC